MKNNLILTALLLLCIVIVGQIIMFIPVQKQLTELEIDNKTLELELLLFQFNEIKEE